MIIKYVSKEYKQAFNKLASHPLQSWDWGEFRIKSGIEVVRIGSFQGGKIIEALQMTIHQLPFTSYTIGYIPKSHIPSDALLLKLSEIGKQKKCIFIKLEPNIEKSTQNSPASPAGGQLITHIHLVPSPHPLFTKYTFSLDLTQSEVKLLEIMHPKTRYNIKIAQKHDVYIEEESDEEAFNEYLRLTFETTKRQKFYAHNQKYHRLMWETMKQNNIAHLFSAKFKHNGQVFRLATWIIFLFNQTIYYPYGASSVLFKNVMASNLLMWEIIKWGKKQNATSFDMWGALGPNPDPNDPWYGFHRFKEGYQPQMREFIGSYDLVINPVMYQAYNLIHQIREIFLKIKSVL